MTMLENLEDFKKYTILGVDMYPGRLIKGTLLYYMWMAGLLLILLMGLASYFTQLRYGMVITGSRNDVSWSLYIIDFIYFVGLAAGGLIVVSSVELFGVKKLKPLLRIGVLQAMCCAIVAIIFVSTDIGHPERFYRFFLSPNFSSMMFFDFMVLGGYTALTIVDLWVMFGSGKKFMYPMAVISLPAAIGLHTVTGLVFGLAKSRPSWSSAIMGPLFVSSAITSSLALLILLALIMPKFTNLKSGPEQVFLMRDALTIAIPVDVFFLFSEIITVLWPYSQKPEHLVGINFILHGPFAFSLFGEILLASLLPFIIILHPKMRQSIPWIVAASVMVVVGVYLKRIFIVMVGMSISPLGELVRYSPTLPELMVTAGWFSLAVLLFTVTTRMLDLDPEGGH